MPQSDDRRGKGNEETGLRRRYRGRGRKRRLIAGDRCLPWAAKEKRGRETEEGNGRLKRVEERAKREEEEKGRGYEEK